MGDLVPLPALWFKSSTPLDNAGRELISIFASLKLTDNYDQPVGQERRKESKRIISKSKKEAFTRSEVLKGPIPCDASSSSAMGALKKLY